jgi:hypothetical protein
MNAQSRLHFNVWAAFFWEGVRTPKAAMPVGHRLNDVCPSGIERRGAAGR